MAKLFPITDLATRRVNSLMQVESGRIIILIIVMFMDYVTSQYPDCFDVTCPDGECQDLNILLVTLL